jgi:uncharacterized protein YndB with AHSA1/START domain
MGRRGSATATLAAAPDAAFALLTDVDRLPEWNAIMAGVVERPEALVSGAQWVVEFRALGQSWRSRSQLEELDPARRLFVYRSGTDDGNPSYARWRWAVEDAGDGRSRVTASWDLHPATFWRRWLLAPVRSRQLQREVPASIAALGRALTSG